MNRQGERRLEQWRRSVDTRTMLVGCALQGLLARGEAMPPEKLGGLAVAFADAAMAALDGQ